MNVASSEALPTLSAARATGQDCQQRQVVLPGGHARPSHRSKLAAEAATDGCTGADNAACTTACLANVCGDGKIYNSGDGSEACDDGVENGPGKACNAMCLANVCGDGDLGPGEACDDGNGDGGDGCTGKCVLEECGNAVVDPGEACDDGKNGDNDDGCTDACQAPACGDEFVQASLGEQCDQGGANSNTGACTLACKDAICGDSLIQQNVEQCDDGPGNNGAGKACNAMCKTNVCGDGDKGPAEARLRMVRSPNATLLACPARRCAAGMIRRRAGEKARRRRGCDLRRGYADGSGSGSGSALRDHRMSSLKMRRLSACRVTPRILAAPTMLPARPSASTQRRRSAASRLKSSRVIGGTDVFMAAMSCTGDACPRADHPRRP
jgi:cysteine-rich repeat protein